VTLLFPVGKEKKFGRKRQAAENGGKKERWFWGKRGSWRDAGEKGITSVGEENMEIGVQNKAFFQLMRKRGERWSKIQEGTKGGKQIGKAEKKEKIELGSGGGIENGFALRRREKKMSQKREGRSSRVGSLYRQGEKREGLAEEKE